MIPDHALRPVQPLRLQGHFLLLRAGKLRLLLPQEEVLAVGHLHDLSGTEAGDPMAAALALSEQLTLLDAVPTERYVVTRHPLPEGELQLAWHEATPLIDTCLDVHELPPAMTGPDCPIDAYAELPEGPALFTSMARLMAHASNATQPSADTLTGLVTAPAAHPRSAA